MGRWEVSVWTKDGGKVGREIAEVGDIDWYGGEELSAGHVRVVMVGALEYEGDALVGTVEGVSFCIEGESLVGLLGRHCSSEFGSRVVRSGG